MLIFEVIVRSKCSAEDFLLASQVCGGQGGVKIFGGIAVDCLVGFDVVYIVDAVDVVVGCVASCIGGRRLGERFFIMDVGTCWNSTTPLQSNNRHQMKIEFCINVNTITLR